jgi:hypothetical protein
VTRVQVIHTYIHISSGTFSHLPSPKSRSCSSIILQNSYITINPTWPTSANGNVGGVGVPERLFFIIVSVFHPTLLILYLSDICYYKMRRKNRTSISFGARVNYYIHVRSMSNIPFKDTTHFRFASNKVCDKWPRINRQ